MTDVIVNRSELIHSMKQKSALVEHLARNNALNQTGEIDYNTDGCKMVLVTKV